MIVGKLVVPGTRSGSTAGLSLAKKQRRINPVSPFLSSGEDGGIQMNDPLSDQVFEKWYDSKHLTAYFDTALSGWQACARIARQNRWAAFSETKLVRLQPVSSFDILNQDLFNEIEAELRRRRFLEEE